MVVTTEINIMTDSEVEQGWQKIKKIAANEPVKIHADDGSEDVYVVSATEYRKMFAAELSELMQKTSAYAKSQGLTEEKLKELFPNDDF